MKTRLPKSQETGPEEHTSLLSSKRNKASLALELESVLKRKILLVQP